MTLEECKLIRDEIARQVESMESLWRNERTTDRSALKELGAFCRRKRPAFKGPYGNIGPKITQLMEETKQELPDLHRALAGIDAAIILHEPRPHG